MICKSCELDLSNTDWKNKLKFSFFSLVILKMVYEVQNILYNVTTLEENSELQYKMKYRLNV